MSNIWCLDIEADGLNPTKIHCLSCTNDEGTFSTTDYAEMREFLDGLDVLIGHNIRRFDIPVLEKLLDVEYKGRVIDTLALSWILEPERNRHGLASWGEDFGIPKPEIDDWVNLSVEEYIHRCEEDTKINWKLWKRFKNTLDQLYESEEELEVYLEYLDFKLLCARLQEKNKWQIDKELVLKTLDEMEADKSVRIDGLASVMPKIPIKTVRTYPARPLKKDGTLSEQGKKWATLLEERKLPKTHKEPIEVITGYDEPNPDSAPQKKDWLFSLGWKPQTFKYKSEGGFGSKPRAIPQINKEAQHGGGICDSIKKLFPKHPELEHLDGLSILTHRLGLARGFLKNSDENNCIQAQIQGLTNTLRFQHAVVVNLPRIDRKYGEPIRGALVSRKGKVLVGADMSSLEDRIKQHFAWKFDKDYVNRVNVPGYEPHLRIAVLGEMMTQKEMDDYAELKKKLMPIRDIAKNVNYSGQYGAGPPKMALTGGFSLELAKKLHAAYWAENWFIKAVSEEQYVKTIGDQMWLKNPINGFYYSLRERKDIFSTLVQGTASYCFDVWLGFVLQECQGLVGQFHDEFILEVEDTEEKRQWIKNVIENAIDQTNEFLRLDRELGTDVQYGYRYSEIH